MAIGADTPLRLPHPRASAHEDLALMPDVLHPPVSVRAREALVVAARIEADLLVAHPVTDVVRFDDGGLLPRSVP